MKLDTDLSYGYFDRKEVFWKFVYEKIENEKGWYQWVTRPGENPLCLGKISEIEIIERLSQNPPLTQDDLIDLELWLAHGGLEMKPKKGIKK